MGSPRSRSAFRVFVALAVATAAISTQGHVLIPVSFEELAQRAEYVVVGRVAGQQARYNDDRTMILTHTTIRVDEGIVGNPPSTIEISEYGGRVGDRVLVFSGQVPFREGENILVFVCRNAGGQLRTCGAHQGRMEVVEASDGTREARGQIDGKQFSESIGAVRGRILAAREVSP